jgi:AraC-like DNA-binding protein
LLAVDGMPNSKVDNHVDTQVRFFSYLPRLPSDATMSINRKASKPIRSLNFLAPGVSMATHGSGPVTGALCVFSPHFLASLSETDDQMPFSKVDCLTSINSGRLAYLGQLMFREAVTPSFASSLFAEAMGLAIAVEIARCDGQSDDDSRRGGLANWQARRLESYIRDHLSEELSLSELARLLGFSVRHLSRAERQAKGVSVHRWLAETRLSEARRLLAATDLPIHEIARRSAFHSASAFASAFHAASGLAPGEFRRLLSE